MTIFLFGFLDEALNCKLKALHYFAPEFLPLLSGHFHRKKFDSKYPN